MTVFLAEDNEENLFVVQANLKKINDSISLLHAADGDKAIELLKKSGATPDIFLIDISMPNKDGIELINWIKAEPKLQNVPTVALTASVFAEMKESYMEHGFDHILEKPFTRRQLADLFQKVFA